MKLGLLILLTLLCSLQVLAEYEDSILSCASPDQSVRLTFSEGAQNIQLSVQKKSVRYVDGELSKVLHFSNGETVIREVETGRTVLTVKELPLLRSDRGFEKKMFISRADSLTGTEILKCRFVSKMSPVKSFAKAFAKTGSPSGLEAAKKQTSPRGVVKL